jgi:hypothetical protein
MNVTSSERQVSAERAGDVAGEMRCIRRLENTGGGEQGDGRRRAVGPKRLDDVMNGKMRHGRVFREHPSEAAGKPRPVMRHARAIQRQSADAR